MREIEFRAKSKFDKNKKWVYGDLIQGENCYISTKEEFYSAVVSLGGHLSTFVELVDKETVGQYTGLKDKNGTKVFEGDIVKVYGESYTEQWEYIGFVKYFNGAFGVSYENGKHFLLFKDMSMYIRGYEVIGNIYDNPELLTSDEM